MSREELMEFRKELAFKRSAIDSKLENSSHGKMDEEEIAELEEKYEKYEEEIKKIDVILNNRSR